MEMTVTTREYQYKGGMVMSSNYIVLYEGGARYKWLYFMQSPIQPEMKYNHFYHTILPNITLLYVKRAIPNAYLVLCEESWVVLLGIS